MGIGDMTGVTKASDGLNQMSEQLKNLYEQSQNGNIINSEDVREIEKLNNAVQNLVQNSRDAKDQLAGSISDLGKNFSSVLESMQAIKNQNPSADISRQLEEASSKATQFVNVFQQLSQTKLEINSDNLSNIMKMADDARKSIEDMQDVMSKNNNANTFGPVLDNLKAISDVFQNGNIATQIGATAEAMGNLNRAFGDQGSVVQNSSMSIKALGDQMSELSKITNTMNSGLTDVFAKITGPGTNVTPFTVIDEQIRKITDSVGTLQGAMKTEGTWNTPENLGKQTQDIEVALKKVLENQKDAFSQALGKVSSSQLEETLKEYNKFRDQLIKNISSMQDVLSDSTQLPEIPANASEELIKQIETARTNAQKYLTDVHKQLSNTKFSGLENVYNDSVKKDFENVMQSGHNDQLMRMATGQSLGNNYDHSMSRIGQQAANIYNKAVVLDSAASDPNSGMNSHQRHAVDFQAVARQAQELASMQTAYANAKDQFSGSYTNAVKEQDPEKRDEAMKKAKERYDDMLKMQNKVKNHAINMGRSFKISDPEDKERLGKEIVELYDYVRSVVKDTAASGDSLLAMGKTLNVDPKVLAGLKEGTNGIKDMKSAMDDAEKSSQNLWSSMKTGMNDMMSPLKMLGKGLGILGIGSLGGGPLAMLTKSLEYHSQQGRDMYESMRVGAAYGIDARDPLGRQRTQERLLEGAKLHQRSGGRISITEMNKAYDSAMTQVGGHYGGTAQQGAEDMNSLVKNTFLMQKTYGIDQGTMNEAYKTFYKDMGQSADEAANSIARVTQTAQAANIPAGQYLKMVTGIAQQFMKIGLGGKDAETMLGNFIHQGMRADVAQSMATQTGQAMGNFANNKSLTGFSTAMMGGDPFQGMADAAYSHEADGNNREGWSRDVSKMMDTMTKQMDLVTGGDPRLRRIVLTDHFKEMGYDQRGASTLTSAFMSGNHELFQKSLEKENARKEDPNADLTAVNSKLSGQLDKLASSLSEQDKMQAEISVRLYKMAYETGPSIDEALRNLHGAIMKFVDSIGSLSKTIADGLAGLTNNPLFQHLGKPALEAAAEHPILATAGTYAAWKMARSKWKIPGTAPVSAAERGASSKVLSALSKNPKTAAFALGAGIIGYNAIGHAHSREGDVGERTYDKLHAIHQSMLNGEMKVYGSGGSGGSGGDGSSNKGSASTGSLSDSDELTAGSSVAGLAGMLAASKSNGYLERFVGTAKHADDYQVFGKMAMQGEEDAAGLAIKSGAKLMRNAFAKNAVTGLITEGAFGAYDLYDHKQKGDLMQGDANRVGANAAVNLGYMATGAAIGSIVPGVGTVAGGIAGGLFGLGVDVFGDKDANGKGFNDHAKDMLYSISTGGDTLDDLEKRRGSLNEGEKIKAKLQMMGYSDKEAEEMSKNLIDNKDELEKHGASLKTMTDEQKAFMALHAKEIGLNKDTVKGNSEQGKKICEDMKDLSSAIRNTDFGNKVNKGVQNKVDANHSKVEHELDDKSVLSTMFGNKTSDLTKWKEKLVDDLKANPEDSGKLGEIADVDEKLKKLERAKYLVDNGEDQRRLDHGKSWDDLSWWQRGGQSRDEFINNQLDVDRKDANEMRDLYSGEYVDKRIADGALSDQQAADVVTSTVTNPGGTPPGTSEAEDRKNQKDDDSRKQASNSNADKVVKQNQKQEELNKEGNKLTHTLIDQEKLLFKALEASGNSNTHALHTKLEEIRLLLDKIQFNTVNMRTGGAGGGKVKGNAYNELKAKSSEIANWVDEASAKYGVNKNLIATVMKQESSFRKGLGKNSAGAEGLMQVIGDKGTGLNPSDDHDNVMIGTKYLGEMLKEFNGDERLAFAGYNMGPNGVKELMKQYGNSWEAIASHTPTETQNYIKDNFGGGGNGSSPFNVDFEKNRGSNGCTAVAAEALAGNEYVDKLSSKSLYVPTWTKTAMNDGRFKSANSDYQSQQGDIVVVKTLGDEESQQYGSHVVVNNGDGTFTGNSSSREHAVVGDMNQFNGKILGYISTGAGNNAYTPSQGSTYESANNVEAVAYNLSQTADGKVPSSQTNIAAANAIANKPGGIVGDAQSAVRSNTGKAFYDGTLIQHHMGGVGIWYGNQSGQKLNWETMQGAIHEAGGAGNDIGSHRQWAAQSRAARVAMDEAAGITVQNPVAARNAAYITPINTQLAKDMAKNIEAQNIPTTITNSNVIKAATDPKIAEENAGKEISVNITIDKASQEFMDGFGPALKETLNKLGARVDNIEERTITTGRTARTALNSSVDQRQQSERDKYHS